MIMTKTLLTIMALASLLCGCQRTSREMWEDTKTGGRYMGRGFRSFCGQHTDSREYAMSNYWNDESEFIPLADSAQYDNLYLSKESPGDPGSQIPGIEGFSSPTEKLAHVFDNIHFDLDNYTVKGRKNLEKLEKIAHYLVNHPKTYIFAEGHADERGAAAYNLALGSKRANSIRNFLIENGVHPDQLFTISYGKERPAALGHDELAWQQNRRSQFKIYAK